jgi:hypothetical protein
VFAVKFGDGVCVVRQANGASVSFDHVYHCPSFILCMCL